MQDEHESCGEAPDGFTPCSTHTLILLATKSLVDNLVSIFQTAVFFWHGSYVFGSVMAFLTFVTALAQCAAWFVYGGRSLSAEILKSSRQGLLTRCFRELLVWSHNVLAAGTVVVSTYGFALEADLQLLAALSAIYGIIGKTSDLALGHVEQYQTPDAADVDDSLKSKEAETHEKFPLWCGAPALQKSERPWGSFLWETYMPLAILGEVSLLVYASAVLHPLATVWFYLASAFAAAFASGDFSYSIGVMLMPAGLFLAPDASPFRLCSKPVPARLPLLAILFRLIALSMLAHFGAQYLGSWAQPDDLRSQVVCDKDGVCTQTKAGEAQLIWSLSPAAHMLSNCGLMGIASCPPVDGLAVGCVFLRAGLLLFCYTLVPLHFFVSVGLLLCHADYVRGVRDEAVVKRAIEKHREILTWAKRRGTQFAEVSLSRLFWWDVTGTPPPMQLIADAPATPYQTLNNASA